MNLTKSALRLDEEDRTLGQVLAAAWIGDLLSAAGKELERQLACQQLAAEEGFTVPSAQLQQAFNDWRRERDLITADDLRRVLGDLGLKVNDVVGCCKRKLVADACQHRHAEALSRFPVTRDEVLRCLPLHVFFAYDMDEFIRGAARRWVSPSSKPGASDPPSPSSVELADPTAGRAVREVFGLDAHAAARLTARETAYRAYYRSVVTTEAMEKVLEMMRPDLVRLRLALANTASENVAREMVCCVREDGETLEEVSARAEVALEHRELLLRDAGALAFGGRLASAKQGELLGPDPNKGGWMLASVVSRNDPQLSHPDVRAVVENRLLDRLLGPEIVQRVSFTWQF